MSTLLISTALLSAGCDTGLQVSPEYLRAVTVSGLDKLSAESGDRIKIEGKNLDSKLKAEIDDKEAEITIVSKTAATLVVPADLSHGLKNVTFTRNAKELAVIPLIVGEVSEDVPLITSSPAKICNDLIYKDINGRLIRGERLCKAKTASKDEATPPCSDTQIAPCSVDGITYDAVELSSFQASDIRSGTMIAGVLGTFLADAPLCAADGGTACLSSSDFPAVDKVNVLQPAALSLRSSITIAGVNGALPDCATDGGSSCIATTNFPSVDKGTTLSATNMTKVRSSLTIAGVSGTMVDCSADGDSGCAV